MSERVTYVDGKLDEVVTYGGCHLEDMGGNRWFLSCQRADGSEFCIWFKGKVAMTEEREPCQFGWPEDHPLHKETE